MEMHGNRSSEHPFAMQACVCPQRACRDQASHPLCSLLGCYWHGRLSPFCPRGFSLGRRSEIVLLTCCSMLSASPGAALCDVPLCPLPKPPESQAPGGHLCPSGLFPPGGERAEGMGHEGSMTPNNCWWGCCSPLPLLSHNTTHQISCCSAAS